MQKDAPVLEQAMRSIALRPGRVVERALEVLADHGRTAHGAHVLIVGVAYKPGIEDVREPPAIEIASQLAGLGAEVAFTDPLVRSMRLRSGTVLESVGTDSGPYDLAIVHTLHPEMATDWLMHVPAVLDATYTLRRMVHVVFV